MARHQNPHDCTLEVENTEGELAFSVSFGSISNRQAKPASAVSVTNLSGRPTRSLQSLAGTHRPTCLIEEPALAIVDWSVQGRLAQAGRTERS